MFNDCSSLSELDLSNWNTINVSNMSYMFNDCSSLSELDLSNFDTSNVNDMSSMFYGCNNLYHIKCKQAFKDWCETNQDTLKINFYNIWW
jgi:surface protein